MSWRPPTADHLSAVVRVPGSKSETNRALVLAALSNGPSRIFGALKARDSDLMVDGLRAFGVTIDQDDQLGWHITPPTELITPSRPIDCGLAGTVLRFLPPLALLAGGVTTFIGDARASERPLAPLLAGLEMLGAMVETTTSSVPFALTAPSEITERIVTIDSSASSQFISGLLLSGARLPNGIDLHHRGNKVPSLPHIEMTIQALAEHGVEVVSAPNHWKIAPSLIQATDTSIEPDLTNAAAFLAAGAIAGGHVTVAGWPQVTTQPGAVVLDVLRAMGSQVTQRLDGIRVDSSGSLRPIDVDLSSASELTPVVAALAAFADGTSTISGVAHIRHHETDRLTALAEQLQSCDLDAVQTADGLRITGNPAAHRADVHLGGYGDHRLAHSAALLGLRYTVILDDVSVTSKTMPDFPERWSAMVGATK